MKSKLFLLIALFLGLSLLLLCCPADDDDDNDDNDDSDDDTGDDDDTGGDDDDDQNVDIVDVKHGSCKNLLAEEEDWPQDILFDYQDEVLTVTHVNGVFNCCLDSIEVELELNGFVLTLFESEYAPDPCFCVCPFDVATGISGLASGDYEVNIYANGEFAIGGQVTIF